MYDFATYVPGGILGKPLKILLVFTIPYYANSAPNLNQIYWGLQNAGLQTGL